MGRVLGTGAAERSGIIEFSSVVQRSNDVEGVGVVQWTAVVEGESVVVELDWVERMIAVEQRMPMPRIWAPSSRWRLLESQTR